MGNADDRDTTPQEAQKNGQSAISQVSPLRELRQDGDARGDRAAKLPSNATPELSDEEVSVLCDIGTDGRTKSANQSVVQSLIERGFITSSEEPLVRLKLSFLAQQTLARRGIGLNES